MVVSLLQSKNVLGLKTSKKKKSVKVDVVDTRQIICLFFISHNVNVNAVTLTVKCVA